ncbi:MAG: Rieske (2Fe-2S) protein [Snowella sp.]|nr:Rieske (2Fe-2S) protein [Snowella sp.]
MNRREFVTLAGVGGAIACAPEVISAATEATQPKRSDGFVAVGTVKELDQKGQLLNKKSPLGPVLLIKEPGSQTINAVNPRCTHEGCTVRWKEEKKILACPCHPGTFTSTGIVTHGPAKRNLKTYQTKVEGNVILIKA